MMLTILVASAALLHFAQAGEFPNGTDTKINFFSCNPADVIDVSAIRLYDRDGALMYPVRLEDLATVELESYNKGNVVVKDTVDVEVYAYVEKNGKWVWESIIPRIFQFLLNNIDGCKMAHNCPLTKGELKLKLPLDLYKYAFLFKFINKSVAHQFVIKMYDADGHHEISCETVQFKLA